MFGFKNKDDDFVKWFRENFVNLDMLDWRKSTEITILEFLDKIKLHDSFILKLGINCAWDNSVIIAVKWSFDEMLQDSESEKYLKQLGIDFKYKKINNKIIYTLPILLVKFNNVKKIEMSGFEDIGGTRIMINSVSTIKINTTEFDTKIEDKYGAKTSLVHAEKVNVLCYDKKGNLIKLKL